MFVKRHVIQTGIKQMDWTFAGPHLIRLAEAYPTKKQCPGGPDPGRESSDAITAKFKIMLGS